ncbi:Hypothetical predicted protein [Octopus vulgaris]|uniref:Uncharacterized protein n=1 Tax=Octopus vulgaris TaxID=6645 RepID=A0AA36B8Q6_OCTVU|nr:Hypothetical predicted protein [Octopus vulgaris]
MSRIQFKRIENEVTELAQECDIDTENIKQRECKNEIFHDEVSEDKGIFDTKKKSMIESYYLISSLMISSICLDI